MPATIVSPALFQPYGVTRLTRPTSSRRRLPTAPSAR